MACPGSEAPVERPEDDGAGDSCRGTFYPNVGPAHSPVSFRARARVRHRHRNRGKNSAVFALDKSLYFNWFCKLPKNFLLLLIEARL